MTSQTQISNLFNLMCQFDTRIKGYHYGWRSDINKNIQNNFDPLYETGRQYPAVQFDVPDYANYTEIADYQGNQETLQITLYFDNLQNIENDGTAKVLNLVEQWDELKIIAEDFISNFSFLWTDKYEAGYISAPKFIQRSNLHNANLLTWEASFTLVRTVACILEVNKVNPSDFPDTLSVEDLERIVGVPPDRCTKILSDLNSVDLLNCILPTYNFSEVAVQAALSATQITDIQDAFCTPLPANCSEAIAFINANLFRDCIIEDLEFTDELAPDFVALTAPQTTDLTTILCPVIQQYSMSYNGVNSYNASASDNIVNFANSDPFSIKIWVKPSELVSYQPLVGKRGVIGLFFVQGYIVYAQDGQIFVELRGSSTTAALVRTTAAVLDNSWQNIVVTYSGNANASGIKIYLNSVEIPTTTLLDNLTALGTMSNTNGLAIGFASNSPFFNGKIGHLNFFNSALTQLQVTAEYNAGKMLNEPTIPALWTYLSGQNSVFTTLWLFNIETLAKNKFVFSFNMAFSDLTTDIP